MHPTGIYLLKVNNRNTKARCEICSELTKKTPERRHFTPCSSVSTVNFNYVIDNWDLHTDFSAIKVMCKARLLFRVITCGTFLPVFFLEWFIQGFCQD